MPVLDFENAKTQLQEFLSRLLKTARIDLRFEIRPGSAGSSAGNASGEERAAELTVDFSGPDTDILLAKGGELLEALEDISGRFLRIPSEERGRISFDSRDFKMLRVEELKLVAETAAENVVKSGAPFALNPMNSRDRRVVHLALKGNMAVRTESEGGGPYRKVVIFPAGKS